MKKSKFAALNEDFATVRYFFGLCGRISKTYIPLLAIASLVSALTPLVNVIIPKFIIDELTGRQRAGVFIKLVALAVALNGGLYLVNAFLNYRRNIANIKVKNGLDLLVGQKIINMDFEKVEDPEILGMRERAIWVFENHGGIWWFISSLVTAVSKLITAATLVALIGALSPLLLLIILTIAAVNMTVHQKMQAHNLKMWDEIAEGNRYFIYYLNLTGDFSFGKDIRLYNAAPLVLGKISKYWDKSFGPMISQVKTEAKYTGLQKVNLQVQMAAAYAYLSWQVLAGSMSIGGFTMYAAAVNTFTEAMSTALNNIINLRRMCKQLGQYMAFVQKLPDKASGGRIPEKAGRLEIEFKNVSFRYPRSENYALKNVSIKIADGEKLSVVGLNGAGKTTFIKLLCRLYEPDEGEILVNGVNIKEYDYNEYLKLFSIVFQDFKLLAFSIRENIALDRAAEDETGAAADTVADAVADAAKKAGLSGKIASLEKGLDTRIYKIFDKNGIEFSGGEAQKLAIARAIYKDAPVVVLDEPTAALDPLAEYEIYNHFNELIGQKTTIYISHRMSSCRFCDRVAVFDGGRIVQLGTHEELISAAEGRYAGLWSSQAQWYV